MALVRKRNYKKITVYIFFLIAVLGIGGYLVYNSLSDTENIYNTDINIVGGHTIIKDYDQEFLESKVYNSLIEFGSEKLPINFEDINKGKKNPFIPL